MWSASFATRELASSRLDHCLPTSIARRLARLTRLLVHIGRIWASATFAAGGADRDRLLALRRRHAAKLLEVLGVEVEVYGDPPAYDEPVLVVANHVSWLDPYVINCINGARFVAKSEVATWPVIGTSAQRFGTFFLERGSCRAAARVKDQLARALRSRDPVAAFPESTTTDGTNIRRFYPAMFQAAIDARAMVQPVAISYRTVDGRPTDAAAFIDDMSIAESLRRLLPVRRIIVDLTFCPPLYARGRDRKELALRARAQIAGALGLHHDEQPSPPACLDRLTRRAA